MHGWKTRYDVNICVCKLRSLFSIWRWKRPNDGVTWVGFNRGKVWKVSKQVKVEGLGGLLNE